MGAAPRNKPPFVKREQQRVPPAVCMPADCEARSYGDKLWHLAVRGRPLGQYRAEVNSSFF